MLYTIVFIYRKQNLGFSIERLFSRLAQQLSTYQAHRVTEVELPYKQVRLKKVLANIFFTCKQKADLYHITGDVHYLMLALPPTRTVLTIHDCVSLERLQTSGSTLKYRLLWLLYYYLPMRRARYITTVSEKSKQELLHYMGPNLTSKVRVIGNYYDPTFRAVPKEISPQHPVLLQIGTADHKNLPRLIQALAGIPCQLVVVGKLSLQQHTLLRQGGIDYVEKIGLTNDEMRLAYEACDIVTFVTTYEGFGMPILEAQAVGRVVLTSNLSPMKEVAGLGAHLVDPYEVTSIKAGLLRLLHDANYRNQLIEAGYINASRYTLDKVAMQYQSLYEEMTSVH